MEAAGIQDVLTKCLGTKTPHNVVHATFDGLEALQESTDTARFRGKDYQEIIA
jgi:small subunit ribosomal protein S5